MSYTSNFIEVINHSTNRLPEYATLGSSGLDLIADIDDNVVIESGENRLMSSGISIHILSPFIEAQVRSRSSLALKKVIVSNSPGTIDSDYTGIIKVILHNLGNDPFVVKRGDRIAQLVFAPIIKVELLPVDKFTNEESSTRGTGGFGSTGSSALTNTD